jgi:hypothetical protein
MGCRAEAVQGARERRNVPTGGRPAPRPADRRRPDRVAAKRAPPGAVVPGRRRRQEEAEILRPPNPAQARCLSRRFGFARRRSRRIPCRPYLNPGHQCQPARFRFRRQDLLRGNPPHGALPWERPTLRRRDADGIPREAPPRRRVGATEKTLRRLLGYAPWPAEHGGCPRARRTVPHSFGPPEKPNPLLAAAFAPAGHGHPIGVRAPCRAFPGRPAS